MQIDTQDIRDEFESLSSFDFKGSKSISAAFQHLGCDEGDTATKNRGFSVAKMESVKVWGMVNASAIKDFGLALREHGNFNYALKIAGIGAQKGFRILFILNEAAQKRNLPNVYNFSNSSLSNIDKAKLNTKQVSYIKYLITKYPYTRIAKIYNVSPTTINHISNGLIWKDVNPAIYNPFPKVFVNQTCYKDKVENKAGTYLPFNCEYKAYVCLHNILWDEPICPHCKSKEPYKTLSRTRDPMLKNTTDYKCRNCKNKFTLTVGSFMHNSNVKFTKWLNAMYLYNKDQRISSMHLAKTIAVTQKTAWFMIKRIKGVFYTNIWRKFIIEIGIQNKHRVATTIFLVNEDGLVLGVSRKDNLDDFSAVGGKMEDCDKDEEACAIRECREETGLDIFNLKLVHVISDNEKREHFYTADYKGEISTDEPHVVKWVKPEVLRQGSFGNVNYPIMQKIGIC